MSDHKHKTLPPVTKTGTTIHYSRNMSTYFPITDASRGHCFGDSGRTEFLPNSDFSISLVPTGILIQPNNGEVERFVSIEYVVAVIRQRHTEEEESAYNEWYAREHNGMSPDEEKEMEQRTAIAVVRSLFEGNDFQ